MVARPARVGVCCYGCGEDMGLGADGGGAFRAVDASSAREGDALLVAATLERVAVLGADAEAGVVRCRMASDVAKHPQAVLYRADDLVAFDDDVPPTPRELFLARKRGLPPPPGGAPPASPPFASCLHGHVLHARCLQGALVAGRGCPACGEPLFAPPVTLLAEDTASCGAAAPPPEALGTEAADAAASALSAEAGATRAAVPLAMGVQENLRMCPACFRGPLVNDHCENMRTHHGQCPDCGERVASGAEIAALVAGMAPRQSVADVIPRCRRCNAAAYFNGCRSCGHLFDAISWDAMPRWDPEAASRSAVHVAYRAIATQLARQATHEAALLHYERALLKGAPDRRAGEPPVRPPAPRLRKRRRRGFDVGAKVQGLWKGHRWYDGTVLRAHSDGVVDILYDDGEVEAQVPPARVRFPDGRPGDATCPIS